MRKVILFLIFLGIGSGILYAQSKRFTAKVVYLKGTVMVAEQTKAAQKARLGMVIPERTVITTGTDSYCDIAFDKRYSKVMHIDAVSEVLVTPSLADTVTIQKGGALFRIKNLKKKEAFQVKTPTAIAGVRGSGMGVFYDLQQQITTVYDLEHLIYVAGLDSSGNPLGMRDLSKGGVHIPLQQGPSDGIPLDRNVGEQWKDFLQRLEEYSQGQSGDPSMEDDDLRKTQIKDLDLLRRDRTSGNPGSGDGAPEDFRNR